MVYRGLSWFSLADVCVVVWFLWVVMVFVVFRGVPRRVCVFFVFVVAFVVLGGGICRGLVFCGCLWFFVV